MPVPVHKLLQGSAIFQRVHAGKGVRPRVRRKFNPHHDEHGRFSSGGGGGVGHVSSEEGLESLYEHTARYADGQISYVDGLGSKEDKSAPGILGDQAGTVRGTKAGDLKEYTGDTASGINRDLRDKKSPQHIEGDFLPYTEDLSSQIKGEMPGHYSMMVSNIDQAINGSPPTTERTAVSRLIPHRMADTLSPGDVFLDLGYVSTSKIRDFSGVTGIISVIHLPVGSRALSLESLSHHSSEGELLLPRGSSFRVLSKTDISLEMELVNL